MGAQGRQPSPLQEAKEVKQAKLTHFFGSKSPKAREIRSRKEPELQPELQPKQTKESNKSRGPMAPFWEIRSGSKDHSTAETLDPTTPSEARVGLAEGKWEVHQRMLEG